MVFFNFLLFKGRLIFQQMIWDRWLWVESYGEARGVGLFGPHHLNWRQLTLGWVIWWSTWGGFVWAPSFESPLLYVYLPRPSWTDVIGILFPFFLKVGRFEINLISPDTKSVVLEKNFKDISSCSQVMLSLHNTVFEGTNWRVPKLATQRRGFHISHLIMVKWSTFYFSLSLISPPFPSPETFLTHTVAPNLREIMLYRTFIHVLGSVATDPSQDLECPSQHFFLSSLSWWHFMKSLLLAGVLWWWILLKIRHS